jgi:hypothetical protein
MRGLRILEKAAWGVGLSRTSCRTTSRKGGRKMSRKLVVLAVLAVACLAFAATAQAQTVTTEIRQGTVLHVGSWYFTARLADGTIKGFEVPPGYMFDIGGKKVPLDALQPGQVITATVTTTTTPVIEHVEEVRQGTVVKVSGRNLFVQLADGTYKSVVVPKGYRFDVDGKKLPVADLRPGMKLTATIVSEKEIRTVTEKEVKAVVSAPTPAPAPK